MADPKLQVVIDVNDKQATKTLKTFNDKVKSSVDQMQNLGIKMAAVGAIATAAFGLMVKEAAIAEGSLNKFNTVFGEGREDMLAFVDQLRKTMPTARQDIIRLAADMQDLLVPLGLARGQAQDLTKGFLDVANKIAAFNDVEPTEVLEAIKSALAGSSEPLKRFGVNALESALEVRAMEDGLLAVGQKFKDLDPTIKNQIRAQALLSQVVDNSSDAINGFESNNDSLIRRSQDLSATLKELKETIGAILVPIIDKFVKKIKPLVKKLKEWTEANPELASKIVIIVAAIGALMLVLGPLLILLPGLIAAFGIMATVIGAITIPVLLVIAAIAAFIAIGVLLVKNWDSVKGLAEEIWGAISQFFIKILTSIKNFFTETFDKISNFITNSLNKIKDIFVTVWEGMVNIAKFLLSLLVGTIILWFDKMGVDIIAVLTAVKDFFVNMWNSVSEFFGEMIDILFQKLSSFLDSVFTKWSSVWNKVKSFFSDAWNKLSVSASEGMKAIMEKINEFTKPIADAFSKMWDVVKESAKIAFEGIKGMIKDLVNFVIDKINALISAANRVATAGAGALGIEVPQIPNIPRLAKGGIVTGPTIAEIGEAGPEAVIPLNKIGKMGFGNITINVFNEGSVISEGDLIDRIGNALTKNIMLSSAVV